MKKEFLPYYISRAMISFAFSALVFGLSWKAGIFALIFFGLFLLYLHSGWFRIDMGNPLLPLRRDSYGQQVQRKALIISIMISMLLYLIKSPLASIFGLPLISIQVAFSIGIIAYFVAQFILFTIT